MAEVTIINPAKPPQKVMIAAIAEEIMAKSKGKKVMIGKASRGGPVWTGFKAVVDHSGCQCKLPSGSSGKTEAKMNQQCAH